MIVPMKKAHIVVLKEEKKKLLTSLQKYGVLMIIDEESRDNPSNQNMIDRAEKSIKFIKEFAKVKRPLGFLNEVSYEELVSVNPERLNLLEEIESLDQKINQLKANIGQKELEIKNLEPWKYMEFSISEVSSFKHVVFNYGYVPFANITEVENTFVEKDIVYRFLGSSNELGNALYFFITKDETEIIDRVRQLGFVSANLKEKDVLITEAMEQYGFEIDKLNEEIDECKNRLLEISNSLKELEILNDQLVTFNEVEKIKGLETDFVTVVTGWVRSDQLTVLEKAVKEATECYEIEVQDPSEGETPPTYTKNSKFVAPFETITDMFSMPNQTDIDPNPFMSLWYWILFGIMMGDAGYGVLMIILFGILIKVLKPQGDSIKLYKVLLYCGITTIFWGVMFGSYFGVTINPILVDPMTEPLKMLIISMIIGALHIISGLLAMAYKNARDKKYWDILFDQVSWIIVILGLGLLAAPMGAGYMGASIDKEVGSLLSNIGKYMALAGAGLILFFGARDSKGIFGRLGGGAWKLYGVTGYLSDILSYSRLLALGLSTAVVSMVMNMLAGMLQTSVIGFICSIFVYIVGHVFNLAMGLLSAYVHDSRLQYIEFFGKFYEGGGYKFEPLSVKTKHIKKINY